MSVQTDEIIQAPKGTQWTRTLTVLEVDDDGNETPVDLSAFAGKTFTFRSKHTLEQGDVFEKDISGLQSAGPLGNGVITVTLTAVEYSGVKFPFGGNLFQVQLDDGAGDVRYYPPEPGELIVQAVLELA